MTVFDSSAGFFMSDENRKHKKVRVIYSGIMLLNARSALFQGFHI